MDAPAFQKISLGALEYKRCNSPMEPPCRFFASVSAAENKPFYFLHAMYEGIIAGGAAGVIAEAVLYPIDTIKTRLQAVHGGGKINFKGLYSGLAGNLAGVLPASAIFVGVYEPTKQKLLKSLPENLSALAQLTAGAIGGAASSLVRVPTEVVKQRMQTGQFASAPDAIRLIVSEEGFKGLYAGYGSFLLRDLPFDAIQFCIYEQMLMGYKLAAKRDPKDAEIAIVGAFAGAITGAMTTPLDVVKTRLMVQGSANQYKGIFDCARTIAKEEGTHALLKVAADHMRLPFSTICCRVLDQEYYGSVLEVQSSLVSLKRQSKYSLKGAHSLRCEQDLTLLISGLKHFNNTSMSEFFVY